MNEPTYLVRLASLDTAIAMAVDLDAVDVLQMQPDGTVRSIAWDGEAPPQPEAEPAPAAAGVFNQGLLYSIAQGLAEADRQRRERQMQEQQAAHERFWQEHQQREATAEEERLRALSELKMPGFKEPDQAES